ncbi:helix-turn-helix domain-containing protein [Runella zeae]|uniref:helix-turn-helix domain-containing protein n=1 Tax=Runella zeae TaxID=94255 RepID=UPI002352C99F|nr:helix-turn-helix domain-containing protein [Runella zeae]
MYLILYMDISNSIRKLRESKHLTQQEVADKLQIERSNYARFEARGNKLTIEQLEKIAEALGVKITEILIDKPQNEEPTPKEQALLKEVETLKKRVEDLESQNKTLQKSVDMVSKVFENAMGFIATNKGNLNDMLSQENIPSSDLTNFSKDIIDVVPDELFTKKEKEDLKKRADEQMRDLRRKKKEN